MIPLRVIIPTRRFPVVNTAIIALNVLVFLFESILPPDQLDLVILNFGVVPARFLEKGSLVDWLSLFTSIFMHGGWFHLVSNIWGLYVFGDSIENMIGSLCYLLFYLLGGVIAAFAHIATAPYQQLPYVGAAGSIAAVLGIFLVAYPRHRIVNLVLVFISIRIVELPAIVWMVFWFLSQFLSGIMTLDSLQQGVGGYVQVPLVTGFAYGMIFGRLIEAR